MAAPTVTSYATGERSGAGTTAATVSTGTTTSSTLLVAMLICGAGSSRYADTPSGWNTLTGFNPQTISFGGTDYYVQFFWHYGTHASTVDFASSAVFANITAVVVNISGAENPATTAIVMSTPDGTAYTGGTDTTNLTFPTATPTVADSLCFSMSFCPWNSSTGVQNDPAGETSYVDFVSTSTGAIGVSYFTHGASAIGTRTGGFNPTWRSRGVATMCVAPPAAGGSTQPPRSLHQFRQRAA